MKDKIIWIIIIAIVVTGWVDTALYQFFLSKKYPNANYLERNFRFIEPSKILEFLITPPGSWVTLILLIFVCLAFVAIKDKKAKVD